MSDGIMSNNIKSVIFHIASATITLFGNFEILPGIYLTLPKSFPLYLDMGNLNPSLFLGNVKQNKNTGYYVYSKKEVLSLSNCLKFYKCFQESFSHIKQSVFLQFWYIKSQSSIIFRQCSVKGCETNGNKHLNHTYYA